MTMPRWGVDMKKELPSFLIAMLLLVSAHAGTPPRTSWSLVPQLETTSIQNTLMAVDGKGDVYLTGGVTGAPCMATRKYAGASGALVWSSPQVNCDAGHSYGIALDSFGNPVAVGSAGTRMATAKYARDTGALMWQKTVNHATPYIDFGRFVAVDVFGDVVAVGELQSGSSSANLRDVVVAKYGGSSGNDLTQVVIDFGEDDAFAAAAAGSDGSFAVATQSRDPIIGHFRWGVAKVGANGRLVWKRLFPNFGDGQPTALAVGADGSVYLAGRNAANSPEIRILRLSSAAGESEWERVYTGSFNEFNTVDGMRLQGAADALILTGYRGRKSFTSRLSSSSGATVWESDFHGHDNRLRGRDVVFAPDGGIVVAGSDVLHGGGMRVAQFDQADGHVVWSRPLAIGTEAQAVNVAYSAGGIYVLGFANIPGNRLLVKLDPSTQQPAANVHGLWWNLPAGSESGWGLNLSQQGANLFATWFTYDVDGRALWFTVPDAVLVEHNFYRGNLYRTTGPAFGQAVFDPSQVGVTPAGTVELEFENDEAGMFIPDVHGWYRPKAITRQVFAQLPQCMPSTAPHGTNYQDLWWRAQGTESGWGINFAHQGDIIFATWFTYDVDGKPMWLVGSNVAKVPGTQRFTGVLYRTRGPAYSAPDFDPKVVTATQVGTMSVTFADPENGLFEYTVNGVSQSKPIARQMFASPPTVCQ